MLMQLSRDQNGLLHPAKSLAGSILVSARSPACWDRHVEHAQVDAELATVLIPVIQHDLSQELAPGNCDELLIATHQTPGLAHAVIVELQQHTSDGDDALIK